MRTLAMTRPGTAVAAEGRSILGLFDDRRAGRAPAQSLTARDLAYLKALYSTRSVSTAAQHRATMARIPARELPARRPERAPNDVPAVPPTDKCVARQTPPSP